VKSSKTSAVKPLITTPEARIEVPRRLALPASAAGNPVIGWRHDLDRLQIEDLKRWYQRWYAPNNAVLVVVGDVDPTAGQTAGRAVFRPYCAPGALPYSSAPIDLPTRRASASRTTSLSRYPCSTWPSMCPASKTQTDPRSAPALELISAKCWRRKQLAVQDPASPSGRLGERHNRSLHSRQSG
jgi:zinc protease